MSEEILRKTVVHEVIKRPYTTEAKKWPKHRRKLETVRERCEDLLELQWPIKEVGYDKLKMDMITKLGLCDRTTLGAYLGRPKHTNIRRVNQEVRYMRSGAIVPKEHTFKEKVAGKMGYLEVFGLAAMFMKNGKAYFQIHYENSNRPYHYRESLEPHIHQE